MSLSGSRSYREVLITGGAGLIGTHMVRHAVEQGVRIVVLDDLSSPCRLAPRPEPHPMVEFVHGSVCDRETLEPLIERCDAVVHLAAVVGVKRVLLDPLRGLDVNTNGTENVLKLATRLGRRVLYTSSSEVYGRGWHTPFSETDHPVLGPPSVSRWSYALSKLHGEVLGFELANKHGFSFIATRMFNVVGPGQRSDQGMVLPSFVEAVLAGKPIQLYLPGTQRRCFMHASDAARLLWQLLVEGPDKPTVVNVGSDVPITMLELAEQVRSILGAGRIEAVEPTTVMPPGFEEVNDRVPDLRVLRSIVGDQPCIPLDRIIRDVAAFTAQGKERLPLVG
jgi:UDP-glucose 4-epimerase